MGICRSGCSYISKINCEEKNQHKYNNSWLSDSSVLRQEMRGT